jgi:hypothetical protein
VERRGEKVIMEPNYLIFTPDEMNGFVQQYNETGNETDWVEILDLNKHADVPITSIQVINNRTELAYAQWGWSNGKVELEFHKIEIKDKSLQKRGIGTTLMKMVIAIAQFYNASKITGTIAGDRYLWDWCRKLGFTIHDQRKLLMEFM